jgi:CRISPR/Cas system-associated exonuclease Cas4 (RecB family)
VREVNMDEEDSEKVKRILLHVEETIEKKGKKPTQQMER